MGNAASIQQASQTVGDYAWAAHATAEEQEAAMAARRDELIAVDLAANPSLRAEWVALQALRTARAQGISTDAQMVTSRFTDGDGASSFAG